MKTVHKVAAVVIEDSKLLMVRRKQKGSWTFLGGRLEEGENEEGALTRLVKDAISCAAEIWKKLGVFDARDDHCEETMVRLSAYLVKLHGQVEVTGHELAEARLIGTDYKEQGVRLAPAIEEQLIPYLKKEGLLDW